MLDYLHFVSMASDQDVDAHFSGFIVKGLFVSPGDDLMAVNEANFSICEFYNLKLGN